MAGTAAPRCAGCARELGCSDAYCSYGSHIRGVEEDGAIVMECSDLVVVIKPLVVILLSLGGGGDCTWI